MIISKGLIVTDMKKTRTKKNWIQEHLSDQYVQQAQQDGFRSRAAYKLLEIHKKYNLIKPNDRVVDLGSAPGSWSQAVSKVLSKKGEIFAIDILDMEAVKQTNFIQCDFRDQSVLQRLEKLIGKVQVDLVISDMAPNISGNKTRDQALINDLNEISLDFVHDWLKPNGNFVVKSFMGNGFDSFVKKLKTSFTKVVIKKPDSSRSRSPEFFLIGLEKL
jgi:23S rRNA (uridine2552-2'-O)-methyltransferase